MFVGVEYLRIGSERAVSEVKNVAEAAFKFMLIQ